MSNVSVIVPVKSLREALDLKEKLIEEFRGVDCEFVFICKDERQYVKGASIYPSFKEAIKSSRGEIVAVINDSCKSKTLVEMMKEIKKGKDIVIAYSSEERLTEKLFSLIIKLLLPKIKTHHPFSSVFVFRRRVLDEGNLDFKKNLLLELLLEGKYGAISEIPSEVRVNKVSLTVYIDFILNLTNYRPLKFALVGASGILVNEGLLWLLVNLNLPLQLAGMIAIELSILNNFILNDLWTFKEKKSGAIYFRCLKYHFSVIMGAVVNYFTLLVLVFMGLNYLIANLFGILFGFIANYVLSEAYVWST